MVGKLTEQTLRMVGPLAKLTDETLVMASGLGATPQEKYGDYWIRPTPKQLRESGEWTLEVRIARDRGRELREQLCSARNTFKTHDEAVAYCIQFGQDIIDGKVQGCSVAAL